MHKEYEHNFGKIRNIIWPIHSFEHKKLLPMFMLFFLISFVYNVLRNMKTTLVVTSSDAGAALIPYLKIGAVLPAAVLFTYIFTKLINRFNREQVFYVILMSFLLYFVAFILVLYPQQEMLRLDSIANILESSIQIPGLQALFSMIRHWNLALFYVLSEMWSAVVLSMLFWGFANEVTKVNEAKRFYAIFALGANSASIFSGFFTKALNFIPTFNSLPYPEDQQWVFWQLASVLFFGIVIITIFYWLNRSIFHLENVESLNIPKKAKKISLGECFAFLRKSKHLTYIVIMVLCYNIIYNCADVMWMYKVKQVYVNCQDVNAYMNQVTSITGMIAVVLTFFVSGNVIRFYGWTVAALITPMIWLITSLGFFSGLVIESSIWQDVLANLVANPGVLILFLGSLQICFGRACKYTVFDETKEITFIPLAKEDQRKGKAVVDGLATRFGKSGGSLIQILLVMIFGSVSSSVPYMSLIILICLGFWLYAVSNLGKIITTKSGFNKNENLEATTPTISTRPRHSTV